MRRIPAVWRWTLGVFIVLAALDWLRLTLWTYGADTGTFRRQRR
jgi:hypothetical protein